MNKINYNEEWKKIDNFNNYSISNMGNIRNDNTNRILKVKKCNNDYLSITLYNKKLIKTFYVHRLVAIHFILNTENKPTVNHIDRNKSNNIVTNLEWANYKEQVSHSNTTMKKFVGRNIRGIWRIDKLSNIKIEYYNSIKSASEWVNKNIKDVDTSIIGVNIFSVCANKNKSNTIYQRKTAFGYKWEYEEIQMIDGEIWKNLNCIDGYLISNYGRVKNKFGRIAKPYRCSNSYRQINIGNKKYSLHILVAKEFVLNPNNKPQVNHIDGNKDNYKFSNLEWVTNKENSIHATTMKV